MALTRKKYKPTSTPETVVYTQLSLPSSIPTDTSQIKVLREIITMQTQGEAVEVSEEYSIPLLMIAFDVVHRTSPEMVLRLNSGRRILLFDHWAKPVFRDKDVYSFDKILMSGEEESKKFIPELIINLETIWKKTNTEDDNDNLKAIKNALREIKKLVRPTMVTTLIGKDPALLFLLTQHMLHGKTGEIWYQETLTSKPIKINSYEREKF